MRKFVPALLIAGACCAAPALAHDVVIGTGVPPRWCPPHASAPPGTRPSPGHFPGPAENFRMNNIELGSFDLGRELPALAGRSVRTRFWLMEPGGIIAEHCHDDRPAFVYLLTGEVVETTEVDGHAVTRTIRAGESVPERNGTHHWWINQGKENVLMVAVDIPNSNRPPPFNPPAEQGVTTRQLSQMLLREQYPHIPEVAHYRMHGRLVTIQPGGRAGIEYHRGSPGVTYVIAGTLREYRSDQTAPVVRRPGDLAQLNNGIWNYWENASQEAGTLLTIEFDDCGTCTAK